MVLGRVPEDLRSFLVERLPLYAESIDRDNRVPEDVLGDIKRLGGFDALSLGVSGLMEAVRLASMSSPGTAHVLLVHGVSVLLSGGGVGSEGIVAFSMTEPGGGSDVRANLKTKAVEVPGGFRVSGVKVFTSNALYASEFLVLAMGDEGPGLYRVPLGDGVTVEGLDLSGFRGSGVGRVVYRDAWGELVGEAGKGLRVALEGINIGRLGYASIALGIAEGSLVHVFNAARSKVVFGSRLLELQGPRWMMANVYRKMLALEALVREEASRADERGYRVDPVVAAAAKTLGADLAWEASWLAVQLSGGRGLARWSLPERFMRDSRVLDIGEGAREIMLDFLASRLIKSLESRVGVSG